MTSRQTTEKSDQGNSSDASMWKREDWLPEKKGELEDVIQQLEEVIRIKEFAIDRLTKELSDVRDQSTLLEVQREKSLDLKEDRIEELEEALRESVRITADREVALDAETQQRTILDQKVFHSIPMFRMLSFISDFLHYYLTNFS
jgi:ELKS/RAB6-interacting/CAST family protein 1